MNKSPAGYRDTTHYSIRTEESYVDWIKRFILFHNKRHPIDMGLAEVQSKGDMFLTRADVNAKVHDSLSVAEIERACESLKQCDMIDVDNNDSTFAIELLGRLPLRRSPALYQHQQPAETKMRVPSSSPGRERIT